MKVNLGLSGFVVVVVVFATTVAAATAATTATTHGPAMPIGTRVVLRASHLSTCSTMLSPSPCP